MVDLGSKQPKSTILKFYFYDILRQLAPMRGEIYPARSRTGPGVLPARQ
jgi:hypothetical protein